MGEALKSAYAEYLDRMIEETDELALVETSTVPDGISLPKLQEWAELV